MFLPFAAAPQSPEEMDRVLSNGSPHEIRALQDRLTAGSPSLEVLLLAGTLFAQHNLLRESAELFERCSRQYPASFEAHYNLALARLGLNQIDAALATLREAHSSSESEQISVEYLEGKIDLSRGDLRSARARLENAHHRKPDEENYALDLAMVYIRSAAYALAVEILQTASAKHPDGAEIHLALALADVLAGNTSEAIALCRNLGEPESGASLPALITAFAYCTTSDYQHCREEADLGLTDAAPHPYLYYLRATSLWNLDSKNIEAVLADLDAVIRKLPSCRVCFALRSRVFEATDRPKQAIVDLKRVVELNAQSPSAWYRLSVLYKKVGQSNRQAEALRNYHALQSREHNQEKESFRDQVLDGAGVLPGRTPK